MRRKSFLALTGLTAAAHRGMVVNGQLPWLEPTEGWSDYTRQQAFETCLAIALAPHVGGLSQASTRIVDLPTGELVDGWSTIIDPDVPDVWAATFAPELGSGDPRPLKLPFGWTIALLPDVLAKPSTLGPSATAYGDALTSLALVNLSAIVRQMAARAKRAGIDFDPDFRRPESARAEGE